MRNLTTNAGQLRNALESGLALAVQVDSGVIVTDGGIGHRIWVKNPKWLDSKDDSFFDVKQEKWIDNSQSLAHEPATRNQLILIGYAPLWTPRQGKVDIHPVVINIVTGEMRRLPFSQGGCMPGSACFSADRTKVYISGTLPDAGRAALFEVDLLTGAERRLTSPELQGCFISPALSPDGQQLAAVLVTGTGERLDPWEARSTEFKSQLGNPPQSVFQSILPFSLGCQKGTRYYSSIECHELTISAQIQ
jgi:hypothetical protein